MINDLRFMDLSIIILSYNTKDITGRCLEKVQSAKKYCEKKLGNKIEVIILDNGSKDGSAAMIRVDFPKIKLIALKENTGFSRGNNIAIKRAKNPYILLLNSDVYLNEDSLYKTLAYFRVNLNCDVLGVKLTYVTGKLQHSCGNLPNPLNITSWILGLGTFLNFFIPAYHPKNKGFFSKAHKVGWVMGAFFAFKSEIFEKSSGFDEKIFMHMEEVEWCKRIKDLGFKIWYVPQIEVVHLHGASSNFDLGASFLNELKGIKYFLQKHYSPFYLLVKFFLILGLILRVITFSLLKKPKRARIYMEGLWKV